MPTDALPLGLAANLLFKVESAFATAPTGNWTTSYMYEHGLAHADPLEEDDLLGSARTNDFDQRAPAPGLQSGAGPLVVPLDLNHFPYWLKLALGAPATTGSSDYVHTFTTGVNAPPTNALEIKRGASFRQFLGLGIKSITIPLDPAGGFRRATLATIFRKELPFSSTQGGTPASALALDQFIAAQAVARINSVDVGRVLGGELMYDTGLEAERYIDGGATISTIIRSKPAALSGRLRIRYNTDTLEQTAIDGTVVALEIEHTKSSTKLLLVSAPKVRLERPSTPIKSGGLMEQEFSFRAHQDSSAAMATFVMKNQQAAY